MSNIIGPLLAAAGGGVIGIAMQGLPMSVWAAAMGGAVIWALGALIIGLGMRQ